MGHLGCRSGARLKCEGALGGYCDGPRPKRKKFLASKAEGGNSGGTVTGAAPIVKSIGRRAEMAISGVPRRVPFQAERATSATITISGEAVVLEAPVCTF